MKAFLQNLNKEAPCNGFSIVEVLVAVSLLALGTMAFNAMAVSQMRAQKGVHSRIAFDGEMAHLIRFMEKKDPAEILLDPLSPTKILNPLSAPSPTGIKYDSVALESIPYETYGADLVAAGEPLPAKVIEKKIYARDFKITKIQITNISEDSLIEIPLSSGGILKQKLLNMELLVEGVNVLNNGVPGGDALIKTIPFSACANEASGRLEVCMRPCPPPSLWSGTKCEISVATTPTTPTPPGPPIVVVDPPVVNPPKPPNPPIVDPPVGPPPPKVGSTLNQHLCDPSKEVCVTMCSPWIISACGAKKVAAGVTYVGGKPMPTGFRIIIGGNMPSYHPKLVLEPSGFDTYKVVGILP